MRLTRGVHEDSASTTSIAMMVAGAIIVGAISMATIMTAKPAGVDPRTAIFESEAVRALDIVVRDPGRTSAGVINWASTPDVLTRFGLALPGEPNFIDYQKVKALRNGTLTGDSTNNVPDYPEVKAALNIKDGNFHLRTYPVLPGLGDPRWTKEPGGRLAYFAHYSGASSSASMAEWANVSATALNVSLAIRNTGSAPAIFVANIALGSHADDGDDAVGDQGGDHQNEDSGGETMIMEQRHTKLLAPGEVQTVWVEFPKLSTWEEGTNSVKLDLSDGYGDTLIQPHWLIGTPPSGGSVTTGVLAHASQLYYTTGAPVKFTLDHYTGDGGHATSDQTGRFVLVGPDGKEWVNSSVTLPKAKNKVFTFTCTNCTTVGTYQATLWDSTVTRKAVDQVHVSAAPLFTEKNTIDQLATTEISLLSTLVTNFDPTKYDAATNPVGDLFGDDSNGPNDVADVLARYSTLVIGSEVSQTALNSAGTKHAIADWVQAGGNLIVLGTNHQQSLWLEPVYHAAQQNANGGITAPDPTNPILVSPERLSYDRYLDNGRAWDVKSDEPFTHVLTRGTSGTSIQDTLTYANPGALGNGTVVLTSYMPAALTDPQDTAEALKFLHNLLAQSYTMLFLDFGPSIPDGVVVGSEQRLVAVPHPNVPGAVVEVQLVMYVFG